MCDINKKVVQLTNSRFSTFFPCFFFFFNTEKWCGQSRTGRSGSDAPGHKCHQCLRCQDILCEDHGATHNSVNQSTPQDQQQNDVIGNHPPSSLAQEAEMIRKTATVVFIHEPPAPQLSTTAPVPAHSRSPTPSDVSIGVLQNKAALDAASRKTFKLPKLPQVTESPRISNSLNLSASYGRGAIGDSSMAKVTEYPMSFGEFLSSGKWSL